MNPPLHTFNFTTSPIKGYKKIAISISYRATIFWLNEFPLSLQKNQQISF